MPEVGYTVVVPEPARRTPGRSLLLAAAGGVLCFLGFVGYGVWPLALLCLVPLWQGLEKIPERHLGAAALVGFAFGWVAYAGGYLWIWRIVDVFLDGNVLLGGLLWLADSFWFASRFALCAALYSLMRWRGWPVPMCAVPSLVVVEWLYPQLFPVYLGHALAERIALIQISDLGGPLLLTGLLALTNAAVCEAWRWRRGVRSHPVTTCAAAGLALLAAWGYGTWRIGVVERRASTAPTLRIALVQANLDVAQKNQAALTHRRYLEQTRELDSTNLDLVVWPETVYMRGLLRPLPISGRLIRQDLPVPLLFGAASVRTDTGQRRTYNSALLVGADGVIRSAYDKNLLIPFTEYVPFADLAPSLAARLTTPSHFAAATDTPAVLLGPWRLSTPICYEAVRPAFVRSMVARANPHLIVTLANDAWFGDSQEPSLHLTMAKMRAVEHRRYLVRATNSGISAVVDPAGREIARTGLLSRQNLHATVGLLDGRTLYTRWGDWPGWLAAAVVFLGLVRARQEKAK